jgi:hypothetical protein
MPMGLVEQLIRGIFSENFCKGVREFAIEHRNVGSSLIDISDFG